MRDLSVYPVSGKRYKFRLSVLLIETVGRIQLDRPSLAQPFERYREN